MNYWSICLAFLFFLLTPFSELISQDTVCLKGNEFDKTAESKPTDFYFLENNFGLVLGKKKSKIPYKFIFFDSSLNASTQYDFPFEPQSFVESLVVNEQPHLFFSRTNAEGKQELIVQKIDSKGKFLPHFTLTTFNNLGGYKVNYKIAVSEDSKKIVLLVEHPFQKQSHEKITLILFDEQLQLIKIVDKTLDVLCKHKRTNLPIISNNGSVYILKKYFNKKSQYYIFHLNENEVEQAKISLRTRDVVSLRYLVNENGVLNVFGFFKSPIVLNYEGFFSMRYDNSVQPDFRKEFFLPSSIVAKFKSKKEIKNKGFGLDDFKIKRLLTDSSGNFFLIASHHSRFQIKEGVENYRKGLVVFKFSKAGNYIWSSPFLYNQHELTNRAGLWGSFISYIDNNELNIIYNSVNYKSKKTEEFQHNSFLSTNSVSFDDMGRSSTKQFSLIYNFMGEKMGFVPSLISKNENELYLMLENENKTKGRLIKLAL